MPPTPAAAPAFPRRTCRARPPSAPVVERVRVTDRAAFAAMCREEYARVTSEEAIGKELCELSIYLDGIQGGDRVLAMAQVML